MNNPRVSVCMPTYNYGRYLAEAVESVIAQSFKDFELLVIDDCSSDNSDEVMQSYAARDSRIRYIRNPRNLGMVENWNFCLREARGEYIKFLFGDDLLTSTLCLEIMVSTLDADSSVSLAGCARKIIDEQSNSKDIWSFFEHDTRLNGKEMIKLCVLKLNNLIGEPSAIMFRKNQALRGFDLKYRQLVDLEMWFHLLENGDYAYIAEPLCAFRVHGGQQSVHNWQNDINERELLLLCSEYISKPYLNIGPFERWYLIYDHFYHLWKWYWKDHIFDRKFTLNKIAVYGTTKFFILLPFYKIFKPLRRLAISIRKVFNNNVMAGRYGKSARS